MDNSHILNDILDIIVDLSTIKKKQTLSNSDKELSEAISDLKLVHANVVHLKSLQEAPALAFLEANASQLPLIIGQEPMSKVADLREVVDDMKTNSMRLAYYLSKYEHTRFFNRFVTTAAAMRSFSSILGLRPNTFKNWRDMFDSIIPNSEQINPRVGYKNYNIPVRFHKYKALFDVLSESEHYLLLTEFMDNINKKGIA